MVLRKLDHTDQAALFPEPARPDTGPTLRWYQQEAIDAAFEAWLKGVKSILLHMATGTGKTIVFSEIAKQHLEQYPDGRVLILCHRKELIRQTIAKLRDIGCNDIGVEQAALYSDKESIVVASVHTIRREDRLERLGILRPPTLIIPDEGHHYVGNTFVRPIKAFPEAKLAYVTATPTRGDRRAMGQMVDEVAYKFDIVQAVNAGYLVPYIGRSVQIDEIDLSAVGTVAGDLHQSDLDEEICKGVESIVATVLKEWPERKGLGFFPKKRSARLAAERFNVLKPGCAACVDDDTPEDERSQILDDVAEGRIQYLCSCMIFTEGFDWPECDLIINGRPTKSTPLYIQMVGRGARVLPGIVDSVTEEIQAEHRRNLIAASAKPHCIIADFVGNAGTHALASTVDALAGDYTPEEIKKAKELEEKVKERGEDFDPSAALNKARILVRSLAARMNNARVKHTLLDFNPFAVMNTESPDIGNYDRGPRASERQLEAISKITGKTFKDLGPMSKSAAGHFLGTAAMNRKFGVASFKQLSVLKRHGITEKVSFQKAGAALNYLQQQGWGKKGAVDQRVLRNVCGLPPISEAASYMKRARSTPPSVRKRRRP